MTNRNVTGKRPRASVWLLLTGAAVLLIGTVGIFIQAADSDSQVPQEKYDLLEEAEAARLEALRELEENPEGRAPKNPLWTPPPSTPEPWPQGLFQTGQSRMPSSMYLFENQWQWDLHGVHVQVYAGQAGIEHPDRGRGLVMVTSMTFDLKAGDFRGQFMAPPDVGSLHIESYDGYVLRLESQAGDVYYLDAEELSFTDESGDPVPTDTPAPTLQPLPSPGATLPPLDSVPTSQPTPVMQLTPSPAPTPMR